MILECVHTSQTWRLTCHSRAWIGQVGTCDVTNGEQSELRQIHIYSFLGQTSKFDICSLFTVIGSLWHRIAVFPIDPLGGYRQARSQTKSVEEARRKLGQVQKFHIFPFPETHFLKSPFVRDRRF